MVFASIANKLKELTVVSCVSFSLAGLALPVLSPRSREIGCGGFYNNRDNDFRLMAYVWLAKDISLKHHGGKVFSSVMLNNKVDRTDWSLEKRASSFPVIFHD